MKNKAKIVKLGVLPCQLRGKEAVVYIVDPDLFFKVTEAVNLFLILVGFWMINLVSSNSVCCFTTLWSRMLLHMFDLDPLFKVTEA